MYSAQKKTKIVATIGPVSDDPKIIRDLILAGVNVFRFNMKHADIAWHEERMKRVREVAKNLGITVGILADLQGPEIRIKTRNGEKLSLKTGELVHFVSEFTQINEKQIKIPQRVVIKVLRTKDRFSIDDGFAEFEVTKKLDGHFWAKTLDNCVVGDNKGLNTPGLNIPLPSLTGDDMKKLDAIAKIGVDFVALSFCRDRNDLLILKKELRKRKIQVEVVAKIENKMAVENIDQIIASCEVVMVARGDLGVESPLEELAYKQKQLILKCRLARKPVIVATQMLQSMIENPMPTRAEATDVANAIYDGTDAVMLSGETAGGAWPVRAVNMMSKIASFNEPFVRAEEVSGGCGISELTIEGALGIVKHSDETKISGVIIFTQTGNTARLFAAHRPKVPIVAVTDQAATCRALTTSFGIIPVLLKFPSGVFSSAEEVLSKLIKEKYIGRGKTYLVVHGAYWKKPGLTNAMFIVTL